MTKEYSENVEETEVPTLEQISKSYLVKS